MSNVLAIVRHAFELPPNLPWEHKSLPHDQSTSKSFVGLARVEIAGGPGFWEVDHGGICHHDERRFDRSCHLLFRTFCLRLCFAACAFYSASQKAVVFRRRELKRREASYRRSSAAAISRERCVRNKLCSAQSADLSPLD
ncbi:MAG: hypothetical protein O3C17_25635 [Planctomycetota bacterium]|nr:hypothetical protein [Planctomycetota bacterium]